ncbi:hypothetical protein RINTHH_6600 [Richelia intracellularis HH01]|uniref:Uncharacterized protein n=1 Tax=Richelia intracellularis HH01 TaxID=1165094 RepID=M1X2H1_9NOST|nr:hypothetical protein RINTHH_6600 [Richelia intracellularis HH01]
MRDYLESKRSKSLSPNKMAEVLDLLKSKRIKKGKRIKLKSLVSHNMVFESTIS